MTVTSTLRPVPVPPVTGKSVKVPTVYPVPPCPTETVSGTEDEILISVRALNSPGAILTTDPPLDTKSKNPSPRSTAFLIPVS